MSKPLYKNKNSKNFSLKDNRIEFCYSKNKKLIHKIFSLMNKIKGKFTLIIDKMIKFEKNEFKRIYNLTKGKINNIFEFTTHDNNTIYLIKTKVLNDILDSEIKFKNYKELINYIFSLSNRNINYIYISLCLNDHYSSLAYVSMISILTYKQTNTYISFYLIVSKYFKQNNIDFINSLYDQYDFFNITFIRMDDRYNKAFISRYISHESYFRFSIGTLLPFLNKIIYLDTDTIVLRDLTNFYNLNFNGKMILGQVTGGNKSKQNRINAGILLLNLKKMRNLNIEKKVIDIINKGFNASFHDQSLLNIYFKKYIGIFPPQYHARIFKNYKNIISWNNKSGNTYDNDYLYFSWKYPTIKHYLGYKDGKNNFIKYYDWWYFARKSKYYKRKTINISNIFNYTTL